MKTSSSYQKVASHEAKKGEFKTCLLLYSGGLDTSVMLKWIQDVYEADVIALTVDVGQLHEDLNEAKEKALKLGAKAAYVVDATNRFADECLTKAIKANADYQGGYHLSTPLGRVTLSQVAVEIAKREGATVIAHGSTGKGNDQVRFESYITTLDPALKIIAPVREWGMGRDEELEYAALHHIPVKQTKESPYSYDDNMWGSTGEGGEIEDPKLIPPLEKILQVCTQPEKAPVTPEIVEIGFQKGIPVTFNGTKLSVKEIVQHANKAGAAHGVGITHLIEDRLIGLKVRGIYESPGAEILITAHKNLEKLVSTRDLNEMKQLIDEKWAYHCYGAKWFEPTMDALMAFQDSVNQYVTGTVKIRLYKGVATAVAVSSPFSLFNADLATFNHNTAFNQNASPGFIELHNLAQKTAHSLHHHD
ncbi:MAG: argininosuccinate synthase [Candidatus Peribacteraceae bacterium]|nr:argininosuccinate synthase [Candidatus Peribacteraceae bacterium]